MKPGAGWRKGAWQRTCERERAESGGDEKPTSQPRANARLTDFHILHMVFHMKTTLVLDNEVFLRLKQAAAERRRTMSELVEMALRDSLDKRPRVRSALPPLPVHHGGGARVDVANREALYALMERGGGDDAG